MIRAAKPCIRQPLHVSIAVSSPRICPHTRHNCHVPVEQGCQRCFLLPRLQSEERQVQCKWMTTHQGRLEPPRRLTHCIIQARRQRRLRSTSLGSAIIRPFAKKFTSRACTYTRCDEGRFSSQLSSQRAREFDEISQQDNGEVDIDVSDAPMQEQVSNMDILVAAQRLHSHKPRARNRLVSWEGGRVK